MSNFEKLLQGILRYRTSTMPKKLEHLNHPKPKAVMFSCMDARVIPSMIIDAEVGDNFVVRSAGNLVPHAETMTQESVTTDGGALELGCIISNLKDVIVVGHSDCRALTLLHKIKDRVNQPSSSPLETWVKRYGAVSLQKLLTGSTSFKFNGVTEKQSFRAEINEELSVVDRLSQINCLQQLENISSYSFLKPKLAAEEVHLHALWFDVHSGEVMVFDRLDNVFVVVEDKSIERLLMNFNKS